MKRLVLFDFDGTITTKDTFLEFIRFYHGSARFLFGFAMLSPWIGLMVFKLVKNYKAKEKVLTWFFKGESLEVFNQKCQAFCSEVVPSLIRPKALDEIKKHQQSGATVVVVSASAENWIEPWCRSMNIHFLATRLQTQGGKITGAISGINCYGAEKESRIRACYDLGQFDEVFAYGDSKGDFEMLALATHKQFKPFRI